MSVKYFTELVCPVSQRTGTVISAAKGTLKNSSPLLQHSPVKRPVSGAWRNKITMEGNRFRAFLVCRDMNTQSGARLSRKKGRGAAQSLISQYFLR
jgi:hypothetical protein